MFAFLLTFAERQLCHLHFYTEKNEAPIASIKETQKKNKQNQQQRTQKGLKRDITVLLKQLILGLSTEWAGKEFHSLAELTKKEL